MTPFNQGITVHTRPISSGKRFGKKKNAYQHMHVQHIYKSVFTQLTLKLAECIVVNKEGLSNTLPREMGEKAEAIKYVVCVTVSAKFHINNK